MRKDIRIRISSGNLVPLLKLELEQRPGALARHRRPDDRVLLGRQTLWRQRDGPPRDRDREPLAARRSPRSLDRLLDRRPSRPRGLANAERSPEGERRLGSEAAALVGRVKREREVERPERPGKEQLLGPKFRLCVRTWRPRASTSGGPALRSPGPDQISRFHGFYILWDLRTTTKRLLTCR